MTTKPTMAPQDASLPLPLENNGEECCRGSTAEYLKASFKTGHVILIRLFLLAKLKLQLIMAAQLECQNMPRTHPKNRFKSYFGSEFISHFFELFSFKSSFLKILQCLVGMPGITEQKEIREPRP